MIVESVRPSFSHPLSSTTASTTATLERHAGRFNIRHSVSLCVLLVFCSAKKGAMSRHVLPLPILPWPQSEKNMAARFFSGVKLLLATNYPRNCWWHSDNVCSKSQVRLLPHGKVRPPGRGRVPSSWLSIPSQPISHKSKWKGIKNILDKSLRGVLYRNQKSIH